ncbi:hypothetical protein KKC1_34380, partial [Calderihabitans maritimus]
MVTARANKSRSTARAPPAG